VKRPACAVVACCWVAAAGAQEPRAVSLDEAVKLALARNPTARVADEEIARAQALVTEARASYLPIVTGVAAYTRLEGDRRLADRLAAAADSFDGSVQVNIIPIVHVKGWAQGRRADVLRPGLRGAKRPGVVPTSYVRSRRRWLRRRRCRARPRRGATPALAAHAAA